MSSVLDIPAQLAVVFLLAATPAAERQVPTFPATARSLDLGYSEDEWLRTFRAHGCAIHRCGLAQRIFQTSSGRVYVPEDADRTEILALRQDAAFAPNLALAAARSHAADLERRLGRKAVPAELYEAHLLGTADTVRLILTSEHDPRRPAAEVVPNQALQRPQLFFSGVKVRSAEAVQGLLRDVVEHALRRRPAGAPHMASAPDRASRGGWQTAVTATN